MEGLNTDERRHMPETDQIVSVVVVSAGPKGRRKRPSRGGVKKRGRKSGPRAYKVRSIPPSTPGVSWEGASVRR